MELGIRGRKALLSGASRGLGKACALALAREGADITIVARTRDVLESTADEIRRTGVSVTPVVGDITTPQGREAALAACPAPDILVNNAEGRLPGDFRGKASPHIRRQSRKERVMRTFQTLSARMKSRMLETEGL